MTDIHGAVGLIQLDQLIDEGANWAAYYERKLADIAWLATPRSL